MASCARVWLADLDAHPPFCPPPRQLSHSQAGDTVIYTSSFFGDELWPADKLSFTNSAVQAAPSPVTFVVIKGENTSVNVKRLPKKSAPPRFGRKLTAGQLALATHVCVVSAALNLHGNA